MSIFRKKLVSALLAVSMLGAFSAVTVYADELDTPVTDNDYTTDDGNTGEIPPSPPVVDDVPPVDVVPDDSNQEPDDGGNGGYDDSGNSSDTDVPDEDISDDDSYDSNDSSDNYDSDDSYDDTDYGSDDYYYSYDDSYYTDYSYQDYNYGMSFNDFERATDYSATVDTETPMVDMYNSNGSGKGTLSSDDWNDIKLNLNKTSVGGVGDFSFIKDNTSDENSNFSILFLIFGIVFVATSFMLMIYLISSSVRSRKLAKAEVYPSDKKGKRNVNNNSSDGNTRTKFIYDTTEIDISNYNDNF